MEVCIPAALREINAALCYSIDTHCSMYLKVREAIWQASSGCSGCLHLAEHFQVNSHLVPCTSVER